VEEVNWGEGRKFHTKTRSSSCNAVFGIFLLDARVQTKISNMRAFEGRNIPLDYALDKHSFFLYF
jgi:hypothetical protein